MKNIIKYGLLSIFLLFAFLTNAQNCIDFEDGNSSNWTGYGLNSLPLTTSQPQNPSNPSTYLTFTDGSGGSVAVNHLNFSGNWLEMGEDGCLCFDYRVQWNISVGTTRTGPSFAIYQSSSLLNSPTDYLNLLNGSTPHSSRIWATFVSSSSSPIQNDIWASYCLPIAIATGNSLPSNAYGTWIIRQGSGANNLTGTAAVNAWNQLIVNVTGLLLDADYNGQPSEVISFDNFCWDCKPQPQPEPCCDIEDFNATIKENNGSFNVAINGGSIPIQEVEISMIDYHVEYSNPDCKPDDMGNFGTLFTSTTTLGNLLLNAGDNNTSSLTWLPGSPGILNGGVNLNIIDPLTLNLDCCDVVFSFCLKIRVKDVNCNVCEKIVCYTTQTEPEPCEIAIKDIGQDKTYCPGDSITINWSGSPSPGFVNVSLFDNTNATIYQVLATGIPNTGLFTYTIPANIPCDPPRSWSLIVEDSESLCLGRSNTFTIECCHQTDCGCGEWLTNFITVKEYLKEIPQNPKLKIYTQQNFEKNVDCGGGINLKPTLYYSFTAPNYVCNPEDCDVVYKWEVVDTNNNVIQAGTGKTFNYNFSSYGNYQIIFTPICGGERCEPCIINVNIKKIIHQNPNDLPHDIPIELPNGEVTNPKTGDTWMDKNLGATQVATSSTDTAAFGDLYQWGRLTDGHEKRTSATTSTLSITNVPGHNKFIAVPSSPDWRTTSNNNLWQGVNGTNNPCPSGYRIPTAAEFDAERLSWVSNDAAGAFASPLKWTMAGARATNGTFAYINSRAFYLSSNIDTTNQITPNGLQFTTTNAYIYPFIGRTVGSSVRCIKN